MGLSKLLKYGMRSFLDLPHATELSEDPKLEKLLHNWKKDAEGQYQACSHNLSFRCDQ